MQSKRKQSAFTLVELLVVVAIIAILASLLLPAVQSARESTRAAQCKNNLKQIGLATIAFEDAMGAYPPGRLMMGPGDPSRSCGQGTMSWFVHILPYLEQRSLHARWTFAKPFGEHDLDTRRVALPIYVCPSRRSAGNAFCETQTTTITAFCGCMGEMEFPGGATGDYAGNHGDTSAGAYGRITDFYWGGNGNGVIISSRAQCDGDTPLDWYDKIGPSDIRDGLSNTTLAGEMHIQAGKLNTVPDDAPLYNGRHFSSSMRVGGLGVPLASGPNYVDTRLYSFGSWHPGVCPFVFSDGSVRSISNTIDTTTLARLCNRKDGEVIGEF